MNAVKIINVISDTHISQLMDLYHEEWWSKDRTEEDIKRMIEKTDFIFAVTDLEEKVLYGFARVLSDYVYFALIFDLIVVKSFRDNGIAKFILEAIKTHPIISNVEYLELCCRKELIPFYEKNGFKLSDGRMNIIKKKGERKSLVN